MPIVSPSKSSAGDLSRSRWKPGYRGVLPSWFFSVWFHLLLLFAAALGLRSCTGRGDRGESEAEWKTVGLVMRTNTSEATEINDAKPEVVEPQETTAEESTFAESELPAVETNPFAVSDSSIPSALPDDLPPVLGPGSAMPSFPEAATDSLENSRIASTPIPPSGLARGETEFLGIRAKGERIVYVIDVSGSMATPPTAIGSAKAELLSSLATLNSDQQFQVIFFNEVAHVMRVKGQQPGELVTATDINRTLARKEILAVQPNLGTRPMPALKMALGLGPDVIFFLTDAVESGLSPSELAEIGRLNDGAARIHAIEFGKGDRLGKASNLERLAEQNGGGYEYHDVNNLGR